MSDYITRNMQMGQVVKVAVSIELLIISSLFYSVFHRFKQAKYARANFCYKRLLKMKLAIEVVRTDSKNLP